MKEITNTCVIHGNIKVYYNYIVLQPLKSLNPIGNFFRSNYLHKNTQRFMENYLKNSNIPKIGEKIYSDNLCSELTVTNVIYDYMRNEGELSIKKLEDDFINEKNKKT